MLKYLVAGDVGGTKCNLGLYVMEGRGPVPVRETTFPSKDYSTLEEVIADFLAGEKEGVEAAVFGVAGPVIGGSVTGTNLPWRVETTGLTQVLGCERVRIMNDLETTAYGALFLPSSQLRVLNPGITRPGNCGVIAAGTGLGQAFLFWNGHHHRPSATEGGHADFAPRNTMEAQLLNYLESKYPRVSYERVLSGPGLYNIFSFLRESLERRVSPLVEAALETDDPARVVGQAAVAGSCPTCVEAVEMFIRIYGAQAGNLALTVMALGGIYVGGGIITKLLPSAEGGNFMGSFAAKGRYEKFMRDIPVRVILNPKASEIGAAYAAADLLLS